MLHSLQEMRVMCRPSLWVPRSIRRYALVPGLLLTIGLGACSGILDVQYPGRIPADQVNDPTLASILVLSVVGDFECAYNNYSQAGAVQSDEFEGTFSNFFTVVWSHVCAYVTLGLTKRPQLPTLFGPSGAVLMLSS